MLASVTGGQSFCGCRALPSIVQMKECVRAYTDSAHAATDPYLIQYSTVLVL